MARLQKLRIRQKTTLEKEKAVVGKLKKILHKEETNKSYTGYNPSE